MSIFKITPCPCPSCGHVSDELQDDGKDGIPKPGDLTVCIKCRTILALDQDLKLREAELNDLMELSPRQHRLLDEWIKH